MSKKVLIVGLITFIAFLALFMAKPVPQDLSYHHFADHRKVLGFCNLFNVISNFPFLFVGVYGLSQMKLSPAPPQINRMYLVLFSGIFFTGLGSSFYHYSPDNNSLVYDRLPMTIVFMAFLSSVIASWINIRMGSRLLIPLILLGIGSVLYWHNTELKGMGDLRFYAFIQYFPMLLIPLILILYKNH